MSEQLGNQVVELFILIWCFGCAWALIALLCWSAWNTCRHGIQQLKRLHGIPCSRCIYFTGDHRLKCTVHPYTALSEEALNCTDFEPVPCYAPQPHRLMKPTLSLLPSRVKVDPMA